jgi:hypothetical protein
MEKKLELRMFGLVPCNISPIQQAIQFGHAVVEYGQKFKNDTTYNDWADNHKTFIILNGGTTNHKTSLENGLPFGSLNQHLLTLNQNSIDLATFEEPDLGDQLTAVVFIVDERVFNRKLYLDFGDWLINEYGYDYLNIDTRNYINNSQIGDLVKNSESENDKKIYQKWVDFIGGEKNIFLRNFLKNFKLA